MAWNGEEQKVGDRQPTSFTYLKSFFLEAESWYDSEQRKQIVSVL